MVGLEIFWYLQLSDNRLERHQTWDIKIKHPGPATAMDGLQLWPWGRSAFRVRV